MTSSLPCTAESAYSARRWPIPSHVLKITRPGLEGDQRSALYWTLNSLRQGIGDSDTHSILQERSCLQTFAVVTSRSTVNLAVLTSSLSSSSWRFASDVIVLTSAPPSLSCVDFPPSFVRPSCRHRFIVVQTLTLRRRRRVRHCLIAVVTSSSFTWRFHNLRHYGARWIANQISSLHNFVIFLFPFSPQALTGRPICYTTAIFLVENIFVLTVAFKICDFDVHFQG